MLSNFHLTPSFNPTGCAAAVAQPSDGLSWPTARILGIIFAALIEGVSAHRQYEQMRRRGISHGTALRRALGS
jgi:hypothetical protein